MRSTIEADFLKAYRAGEKSSVEVLRLLKTAFLNAEIEKRAKTGEREAVLSDEEAIAVIRRQVKALEESLVLYRQGKREDLAGQAEGEIATMKHYLPAELSEDAVREAVRSAVATLGTHGPARLASESVAGRPQDFGRVMGEAMKALKGKASGDMVSRIVKEFLK